MQLHCVYIVYTALKKSLIYIQISDNDVLFLHDFLFVIQILTALTGRTLAPWLPGGSDPEMACRDAATYRPFAYKSSCESSHGPA